MDDEVVEEVRLDEFDRGTTLTRMSDGCLHVALPLMPPSWWNGRDALESLDQDLARAVGAEVEWADKELFIIAEPPPDAIERVRACLLEVRRTYPGQASPDAPKG